MSSWSSGYVSEITYTHGFYRELTPNILRFGALSSGFQFPTGALNYCELGCGQGVSMNLLAASNPDINFYATDFNPTQINGAKALAEAAKLSNVHFYDTAFEEFADEKTLPETFDVITLHGIYSWINDDNRAAIVDFIHRKLNVGGIVYISYNAYPGWASAEPMRQFLYDQAQADHGPITDRLNRALKKAEAVAEHARFFADVPTIKARLADLKTKNPKYLAHEYLNDEFHPFYFSKVAADLSNAKLTFAGSAHILDHVPAINLTAEQQNLMAQESDVTQREGLRDYIVNQQFRRDLFGKGLLPHTTSSMKKAWLGTRFVLAMALETTPKEVTGALGKAELQADIYTPILESFAKGPLTLQELVDTNRSAAELGWGPVQEVLTVLVGAGILEPCLPAKGESARQKATTAINDAVIEHNEDSGEINYLASPVTGGAVSVGRFAQLFMAAYKQGEKNPEKWAQTVWALVSSQGQKILKDGKVLPTEQENLDELLSQAKEFESTGIPTLKALRIL